MSNSLESLLNRMQGGSITNKWGAIVAFGREQLNRLLEVQYLTWLHDGRFIPPISGVAYIDSRTESMTLDGVLLGKPVLSFESASLNESKVTLTMNLVGGTYTAKSHPIGNGAVRLLSSFRITEAMGYKIQMKVSLNQIEGEVDQRGRVTLDVASDVSMTCNLGGMPGVDKHVAALIQSRLAVLPQDQRIFELGLFDFSGYNPLCPTGFYIRTQKAPASDDPADGAVLLFIRLKIHDENGDGVPIEGSGFPYLIPDDEAGGRRLYSASLVLNSEWTELLDEVQLDVLKNLLFPGDNVFIEVENGRHTPHDLLVLGNIRPTSETVTVEPTFISLKSGGLPQTFIARKSDGASISAQWTVSNPLSPLSVGSITPTGGVYTAPDKTRMGKEQQPIVVTAQYMMGGKSKKSSAMVLGVFESMSISPRVCLRGVGSNPTPVDLVVTTLGNGILRWPTLLPDEGTLEVIDNNHAIYTPPVNQTDPLAVQKIIVTDQQSSETIEATVVLLKSSHMLPVDPAYVEGVTAGEPIQLYADLEPEDEVRWVVIGEGDVDENGLFTPPDQPRSRISVVRCSHLVNGTVRSSGLSVIQLSEQVRPEPHWKELHEFSIAVNGLDSCFSNGFQQVPVIVTIATEEVTIDGVKQYIPVSDAELATLRLVDKSNNVVPFIPVGQEGIEYGKDIPWAVSKINNRFRFFSATAARAYPLAPPTPKNNGVRYRELYIHLTRGGSATFFAQFDSPYGTLNSTDNKSENYEVTVQGIAPSTPAISHYEFRRERRDKDPSGHDGPPTGGNPEKDYFSYYRWSLDYWFLSYLRRGIDRVLFATLSIEKNISTIQWESELIDETFFSYTGYAFNPANFENSDSPSPEGLSFDPYLWGLMRGYQKQLKTSFDKGGPAAGELLISLHRTDDMQYWYDGRANGDKRKFYRQQLDPDIHLVLLDEDGNRHSLAIGFEPPSEEDSRNTLVVKPR